MELIKAEANVDVVADLRLGGRLNSCGDGLTRDGNIQIDLCAHELGYVNLSVKLDGSLCKLFFLIVNVLGTDTEDDLFANISVELAVCALVGMGTELVAYRPVRKKGTNMTALITAIAMSLFLENLAQAIPAIGPNPKVSSQIFRAGGIRLGSVTMEYTTIITLVISAVVMLVLFAFTQKTRLGRAMRCVSEDKAAATLMGINVNHTILLTFGIGSSLAAVAALMYMAQYPKVYTTMGGLLGLKAFVSAVLGGIGIIPGAVLGGIVIGLVESFTTSYISSSMADTFVFLILIIVLVIKPAGILGKNVGEKV